MSDNLPLRGKMHLHSSKDSNADNLESMMQDHDVRLDKDARHSFLYAGYEVVLDILVNQNGFAYATHVNGVKLTQPVKI